MPAPMHVAVIDDDDDVRLALESLFQSFEHRTSCFADAGAFLTAFASVRPDVVVTDYHMPDITGIDLARALIARGADVPVILISAFLTDTVQKQAKQCGIVFILKKPFEPDQLLECVDRAVARRPI